MSHDLENSVSVEALPVSELHIIEESEYENGTCDRKNLKDFKTGESVDSNDSDVCLNYESDVNDRKEETDASGEVSSEKVVDNETTDSGSDDNGSGGKDSGCEVSGSPEELVENKKPEEEETVFEPPDEELANRIRAQVEFYFSDDNIVKDAFLLKHVKRNKEGYVSLKLISSFKRVKHLAKDWRAVAYALEKSTELEVNEAKTKLRRVKPLPVIDQTSSSRSVVAIKLPMEKPSIENIAELFKEFGEITSIRILRPGNSLPSDVRSLASKLPEIHETLSALIEFEKTESAKLAVERLAADWRTGGMKVVELNVSSGEKKKKVQNKKTVVSKLKLMDNELSSSCQSSSEAELEARFYRRTSSPVSVGTADITRLQKRFSAGRESGTNFAYREPYRERPCGCCKHLERRYSSSGSGYDSPLPTPQQRHFSFGKEAVDAIGYQIPVMRRFSGVENSCCSSRRSSRDSDSSYTRFYDLGRKFSRDSISSNESGLQRRFSRDSISSEGVGTYRRLSRESLGSDVFAPAFLLRRGSKEIVEVPRRASHGSISGCNNYPLIHSGSRSSFHAQPCSTNCSSHLPENVVRMPKGPDGSKGFGGVQ